MKTGIIGLPQVGKTSLFVMLTKQSVANRSGSPREAHLGVTKVPDDRLDRVAEQCNPKKLVHATYLAPAIAVLLTCSHRKMCSSLSMPAWSTPMWRL